MHKLLLFFFALGVTVMLGPLSAVFAGPLEVIGGFPPGVFQSRAALDGPSAPPAFSITQTSQTSTTTNSSSSPSFSGLAINSSGIVVAAICHGPNLNNAITGLTIGGVSATQATSAEHNSGAGAACDIWYASGVSGSTATVTWGGTGWSGEGRIVVTMYSVIGAGAAFSAGGGNNGTGLSSLTAAVSIPSGGGAIAALQTHSASSGSGTPTNLTLDTNNVVVATSTNYVGHNVTGSGSTTMGVSWSGGATDAALAIATFSP